VSALAHDLAATRKKNKATEVGPAVQFYGGTLSTVGGGPAVLMLAGFRRWCHSRAKPLLTTVSGGRLRQGYLWELVRRLVRAANIESWERLSPRSLRHSAITFALDTGASLRDVRDYAGHKDPRTTRRYGHAWDGLDRNAAYAVAAYLA
jgi:integrase